MARASSPIEISSFAKGWNTDAGPLNYQPDSAIDITNFSIEQDGSVRRRLGMAKVDGGDAIATQNTLEEYLSFGAKVLHTSIWEGAGDSGESNLLVLVRGSSNRIAAPSRTTAFFLITSTGLTRVALNFTLGGRANPIQVGKKLVVPHTEQGEFATLHYDEVNRTLITEETYPLKVRDLWGLSAVYNGLDLTQDSNSDVRPIFNLTSFPDATSYIYNLRNTGWAKAGIPATLSAKYAPLWLNIATSLPTPRDNQND